MTPRDMCNDLPYIDTKDSGKAKKDIEKYNAVYDFYCVF
jgi:hypothetical protein